MIKDVSEGFLIGSVDDECLPVHKCICGARSEGWPDYVLSIYEDSPIECPGCHRKFFFRNAIRIFEVIEDK